MEKGLSGEDKSFLLKFSLSKMLDFEIIGSELHNFRLFSQSLIVPFRS